MYLTRSVIATQGREDSKQWLTSYKVAWSVDGVKWRYLQDRKGKEKVFEANQDKQTVVEHDIEPQLTRFVRLHPVTYYSYCSVRWEIYGNDPLPTHESG